METDLKIVITGASGFLGKKLLKFLEGKRVYPIYNEKEIQGGYKIDLTDNEKTTVFLEQVEPDLIIHTAGLADVDKCEKDKVFCHKINVETLVPLIEYCKKNGKRLIFASTNYVFNGDKPPYWKNSERKPVSYYGVTKVLAEDLIREHLENYLILRLDMFYGYNDDDDSETYPIKVMKFLRGRMKFQADCIRIRFPTLIDDIAQYTAEMLKGKMGIAQVAGPGTTRYDWAVKIAEIFDLDKSLIKKTVISSPMRPKNPEMVLCRQMRGVEEGLREMKRQMVDKQSKYLTLTRENS